MTNIYVKSQNKMQRRESERDAEKTAAFSIFAQVNEEQKVNEINTLTQKIIYLKCTKQLGSKAKQCKKSTNDTQNTL